MGELVTKEWLKQMLEGSGRFGDHNVEICLLESKRALAKGENYMTIPIRCHVVVVVDSEEHSLDLFIKILPAGPEHRALAESFKVFQTEALVYNELIPEITKNVESLGLSKECLPNFPRSVFCKGTGDDAVICMEDLGRLGYRLSNRLEGATEEETRAVMKAFAKFHANSIEIARKHQSSLADGSSRFAMLREDPFDTDAMRKAFEGTSVFETMLKALRGFPGQAENADRLERHMNKACAGNYLQYFGTLSRFVGNPKLAGFRLGDCWLNNMMFRDETSEDGSKRVAAVKLLDLQVVQYGSTIADLQYFFGASVRNEVLSKRRELIRDEYFPELMRVLSLLGSPLPDSGYSFDDFWADFQQHSEFCLVSAMFVLPIVMAQASTIPDYDTGEDLSWEAIKNVAKDAVQADCGRIAARFAHLVGIMVQEQVI